jgi:hypothetical protein
MGYIDYENENYCTRCRIRYPKTIGWCVARTGCGNQLRRSPKTNHQKLAVPRKPYGTKTSLEKGHTEIETSDSTEIKTVNSNVIF